MGCPFLIEKSGGKEGKESRREQIDQRPKTKIDHEQRCGPTGGVEDDSGANGNCRNRCHGLILEHLFLPAQGQSKV
jgi:hypothetical protein